MQFLAIYDMDKTITAAPTWTRFLAMAARSRAPWRLALFPAVGVAGIGYLLKLTDRAGLKQFSQRLLLGGALSADEMARVAQAFAAHEAAHGVLQGARAQIAADRAAGYRLVMATASHGYYAAAIGRLLGFDDVIATEAKRDGQGRILSLIEGDNCYGPAKLRRIEGWMAAQGIARGGAHVRAYSDHVSDAPLLGWADEGFAVNAHGPLRRLAAERGWPLLDWR
ncbi:MULTISPECIES: HAD family phosphatase [unclassified Sphingomonas]|uniref:HAD family hydrolase n=1 Tax=Sphingomonas TaxID=13687 RepID=UPI00095D4A36|nr:MULTISPECIES: HAD-IB family phosphatase [unclassified Sphingomonas]MBN8810288.1 HAD-IB family phosphatase [Sphingomonas sp.]OJY50841.1 MAG: haloacid dehalogenase [Sphingomonas sp. 67-41]